MLKVYFYKVFYKVPCKNNMSENPDSVEYDSETSSDDEYEESMYPYNICKSGREYIMLSAHYSMIVPSLEFEQVHGDKLEILRKGCKNIKINNSGVTEYWFDMLLNVQSYDIDNKLIGGERETIYINNDPEFDAIVHKVENIVASYADDAPHMCGYSENNKVWYKESIGNYSFMTAFKKDKTEDNLSLKELLKLRNCSVKDKFIFNGY